jgi:DNA polymerase III delta prime subunit
VHCALATKRVSATQIHTLGRGAWVTAPENLILAGPIGTGKTHLAIALGVEASKQKRRVLFTRAADLVRQLLEARDARELTRLQQRLRRVEVLIIDELGFVPFDRVGGELLFNLITNRYERRATVVTTNLAFAEWVTVFAGDEKLTPFKRRSDDRLRIARQNRAIVDNGPALAKRRRRSDARPLPDTDAVRMRRATCLRSTPDARRLNRVSDGPWTFLRSTTPRCAFWRKLFGPCSDVLSMNVLTSTRVCRPNRHAF